MKLIRLTSGEEIICEYKESMSGGTLIIEDGVQLIATREGSIGFMPFMAHANEEPIQIAREHIMFVATPKQEIVDNIRSARSGIEIPAKGNIIV